MRYVAGLFIAMLLSLTLVVGVASFCQRQRAGAPDGVDPANSELSTPANTVAVRRLNAKSAVTRRLVAGELTLRDAAAWFQYLDAALSDDDRKAAAEAEGLPDGERYERQVIRWALGQMESTSSSQSARLERRLQAELNAILQRDGGASPETE